VIPAHDPRWKTAAKLGGQAFEYACEDAKNGVKMLESLEHMLKSGHFDQASERIKYLSEKFLPIMLKQVEQAKADNAMAKTATSPDQWDAASQILEKKAEHEAIKLIKNGYEKVLHEIDEADKRSKNMKRVGVGRTEDPNLVLAHVAPAIEDLGEECVHIAKQMKERFGGV
jgi:hypothetical protein